MKRERTRATPTLPFALTLATLAAACSSSSGVALPGAGTPAEGGTSDGARPPEDAATDATPKGGADGGDAGDAGFVEAPHAALPQIPMNGGPVIASPKIVTITFAGYADDAAVKSFGDWIAGSSWLTQVGHDYGVGAGTHAAHVVLPMTAPTTTTDLDTQALLEQELAAGVLPSEQGADAGASDAGASGDAGAGVPGDYLYVLFYPPGTTTGSFLGGPDTCADEGGGHFIGGYHWETQSGAYHVPYAVVPTCSGSGAVEGAADLEASASHEIIEAASDPYPYTATAWAIVDPNDPWSATAGEVADLCEGQVAQDASGFSVQRVWSNSAAAAGTPPCVPAPADGFFDVSPAPNAVQTVAAGSSVTFTLTGFSTAALAPWQLSALVAYSTFTPTIALGATTMGNGQTTTLKLTVPAGTPSQSYAAVLVSSYRSIDDFNYWPVAVVVP